MADEPDPINESIDDLRAKLEEERAARQAAEGRASSAENQARQTASKAGNEVQQSRMQILEGSLDQMKTQRDILKARYRSASAEGDHDAVAEIASEMGDVSSRLLYLENGKAALQAQIDNPPMPQPTGDQRTFDQLSSSEKVERIAAGLSAPSAAWVRRHPEWTASQNRVNALVGAHNAAIARGKVADTAEYFADVERMLEVDASPTSTNGSGRRDTGDDAVSAAARPVRDAPPPAAPARTGSGGRTRTLSPLEREAAKIAGQSDQEYAEAQDALVKEGRITRH